MRRNFCLAFGALALLLFGQVSMAAPIVSSFDNDLDGWTTVSSNATVEWQASGGNPGGYAFFTDVSDGVGAVSAPAKFLGNLSAYVGGELDLDYKVFDLGASIDHYLPLKVTIYGNSTHYSYTVATPDSTWDTLGWQTFSVPMTATAWGVATDDWSALMGDVTELQISAESAVNMAHPYDTDGLDNITLSSLGDIPEPATMVMLTLGAAGLIARRRARSHR